MVLKNGKKNSEFGNIPIDWESISFSDVISVFSSGATPYRGKPKYYNGKVRWITSGELNYNTVYDTEEKISEEAVRDTNLRIHPEGTFLIAITGLEAAGTRGRCGFVGRPSTTNQSCMALYVDPKLLNSKFLYHFYVWQGQNLAFKYCQGTKQQSYTASIAKKLPIILPPLSEQKAIAKVLSDTDNLIQSLEKQIAKKRLIKQGAMQKLLSPKEGWEKKKLGEFLQFEQPTKYLVSNTDYDDNYDTPVLTAGKSFVLGYSDDNHGIFKSVPVIIFDDFTTASKYVTFPFKAKSSAMKILKPVNKKVNLRFIYESMQQIEYPLGDHKRHWIGEFQHLEIKVPSIEEQSRIESIISDMDAEIEFLALKISKYHALKKGLMQNLLTGKIRLQLS